MNRSEQGFSLVEILVALLIFSIVAVGTITVIGATTAGGFLATFPTSFATTRAARDYTAASTYLQAFHEFVANAGFAAAAAGTYCVDGPAPGAGCLAPNDLPYGSAAPLPSDPLVPATSQLNWVKLEVVIEEWPWDTEADMYCDDDSNIDSGLCDDDADSVAGDSVKLVQSTLTWIYRDPAEPRKLVVKRFLCSAANAVRSGSTPQASWCP